MLARCRAHKEARRSYEAAVRALKARSRAAFDAAATEANAKIAADGTRIVEAREIESESRQAVHEARDSALDLARSCIENLRDYREANTYVRTTDPPKYFRDYPDLTVPDPIDPELPGEIGRRLAEAEDALRRNREAKAVFDRALVALIGEEDDALGRYLEGVLADATFRANQERRQDCDTDEPEGPANDGDKP